MPDGGQVGNRDYGAVNETIGGGIRAQTRQETLKDSEDWGDPVIFPHLTRESPVFRPGLRLRLDLYNRSSDNLSGPQDPEDPKDPARPYRVQARVHLRTRIYIVETLSFLCRSTREDPRLYFCGLFGHAFWLWSQVR